MKNHRIFNFALVFVTGALCLTSLPSFAGEIVQARQQRFKQSGAALQIMSKQLAPAEDFEALKQKANELIEWANEMPGYFPPGSDTPEDEAKPNVFTDPEGFQKAAQNMAFAAQMIENAAKEGDSAAVKAAIGRTGATCKACHKKYRAKK